MSLRFLLSQTYFNLQSHHGNAIFALDINKLKLSFCVLLILSCASISDWTLRSRSLSCSNVWEISDNVSASMRTSFNWFRPFSLHNFLPKDMSCLWVQEETAWTAINQVVSFVFPDKHNISLLYGASTYAAISLALIWICKEEKDCKNFLNQTCVNPSYSPDYPNGLKCPDSFHPLFCTNRVTQLDILGCCQVYYSGHSKIVFWLYET